MLQVIPLSRPVPGAETWRAALRRLHPATRPRLPARRLPERPFKPAAEASVLEQRLRPFSRRLRRRRTLEQAPRALLAGAGVCVAAALLARLFGAPGLIWIGLAAASAAAALMVAAAVRRPVGLFETARSTDAAARLRERLATALELLDARAGTPLARLQIDDATAAVGWVTPKQAFPYFARGSQARRTAVRDSALALLGLLAVALLVVWPADGGPLVEAGRREKLALADTTRTEDDIVRPPTLGQPGADDPSAVVGRSERPPEVGEPGLVAPPGQPSNPAAGQQGGPQPGQPGQPGQQDAQSQQNPNLAERQQALQELGNALRQSQTARPAGEWLRHGDTQRAADQLNQVADQTSALSPGERQSLAQAFRQAGEQIGSKDRPLADAARRAAEALAQFRNQEAQQAIRDAANQVRDTGQQAQAQRDLQQRAEDLQNGRQPQLPPGQQPGQGQPGQPGQGQPGQQAGQQPGQQGGQQPRQGGEGAGVGGDLSAMEAALRSGGLQPGQSGPGAGTGSGTNSQGAPQRLNVDARTVQVAAEAGEGPTQWRPPSPNAAPAAPPAAPALPAGPASALPVGAGLDINNVPWDMTGPVRDYFTLEPTRP